MVSDIVILHPSPRVSVLAPVRNGAQYLLESVNSVLAQTFGDFEFIVIDDHSTDDTLSLLEVVAQTDARLRVVRNPGVGGLAHALNYGLTLVRGEFIARMDGDDICEPDRLARQVSFLDANARIDVIGSALQMMDADGKSLRMHREPLGIGAINLHAAVGTPFAHPSVLLRTDFLRQHGLNYADIPAEDYDLWLRMLRCGARGANLPEPLLRYRVHPQSASNQRAARHGEMAARLADLHTAWLTDLWFLPERFRSERFRQIAHALIVGNPVACSIADEVHIQSTHELLMMARPKLLAYGADDLDVLATTIAQRAQALIATIEMPSSSVSDSVTTHKTSRWVATKGRLKTWFRTQPGERGEPDVAAFTAAVPVIVNVRDRLSCLQQLVSWLEGAGHRNLILLDNDSTYPPLLEWLEKCPHRVIRLGANLGHTALWQVDTLSELLNSTYFVYTDPDVIPDENCPHDVVFQLWRILQRQSKYVKAGLGLHIDDLPDHFQFKEKVINWESGQYGREVEPEVYEADIDTTFALYRPGVKYCYGPAVRTRDARQAHHLPWYDNSVAPNEEERYYRAHAAASVTTWNTSGELKTLGQPVSGGVSNRDLDQRNTWRSMVGNRFPWLVTCYRVLKSLARANRD